MYRFAFLLLLCLPAAISAAEVKIRVTNTQDAADANPSDGQCLGQVQNPTGDPQQDCTLRAAVMEANARATTAPQHTYVIEVPFGTYVLNGTVMTPEAEDADTIGAVNDLDLTAPKVEIRGTMPYSGQEPVPTYRATIKRNTTGAARFRLFDIRPGGNAADRNYVFTDLILHHGYAEADNGGAIRCRGAGLLVGRKLELAANQAPSGSGGAVYSTCANTNFEESSFHHNQALIGAIGMEAFDSDVTLTLAYSSMTSNTDTRAIDGRAQGNWRALYRVFSSTLADNATGVYLRAGTDAQVISSTLAKNIHAAIHAEVPSNNAGLYASLSIGNSVLSNTTQNDDLRYASLDAAVEFSSHGYNYINKVGPYVDAIFDPSDRVGEGTLSPLSGRNINGYSWAYDPPQSLRNAGSPMGAGCIELDQWKKNRGSDCSVGAIEYRLLLPGPLDPPSDPALLLLNDGFEN